MLEVNKKKNDIWRQGERHRGYIRRDRYTPMANLNASPETSAVTSHEEGLYGGKVYGTSRIGKRPVRKTAPGVKNFGRAFGFKILFVRGSLGVSVAEKFYPWAPPEPAREIAKHAVG